MRTLGRILRTMAAIGMAMTTMAATIPAARVAEAAASRPTTSDDASLTALAMSEGAARTNVYDNFTDWNQLDWGFISTTTWYSTTVAHTTPRSS